jgi:hypothetical protein
MPIILESSYLDTLFSLFDFCIQVFVLVVYSLNILTQEGFTDLLAQDTDAYQFLQDRGLLNNVTLISLFALAHVN